MQRFAVIESFNLIVAACFGDSDSIDSSEKPCLLVIDLQTTKVLQKIHFAEREYPSAVTWHTFDGMGEA